MAGTKVGDLFVKLGMDLSEFSKGVQDAKRTLDSVGREFTSLGTSLSLSLTAPLAAIAGFAVKSSAGFESAMNKVEGLLKDFSNNSPSYLSTFKGEMDSLSKLAIKLGADTQFSAKQAADAMGELAAAGFTSTQILKGMEGVLSLAAVGQMKLAEAAEIAAAVVGGFGISAEHISKVADVLAKASSVSAASVQDLGYAFKYIGPVAKAAGVSFNEVAGALSILANAGIKGESAGTALRNLFQDILKPSTQAQEVMDKLGVKINDATGKLKPLADILDEFNKKGLTLTEGFKIWGARFSDVIPLLQKGGDELRKMTAEMEKSEGSAKKMADTFRRGLAGMWEEFTGSLETLGISIGKLMQPAVEPIIKWMTQMANKLMEMATEFGKLDPWIQGFVGALVAIPAAIGPVLLAIGGVSSGLGALAGAFSHGVSAIGSFASGIGSLINGVAGLPAMISNITLAVQSGMVGALTMAEKALLGLGYAAAGAAAIFAGWSLGTWLRNNVPAIREFGDAVGDLVLRIPGVESGLNRLSGVTASLQRSQADGIHIVKMWEERLRAAGFSVSQGSLSIEAYTDKLRGMMQQLIQSKDAHAAVFGDASSALNAIRKLQQELSNVASKATIGMTDKGAQKAAIIEVENAMKGVLEIQNKINESVKAGKIDKAGQVQLEKQLADSMSFANGVMGQLGVETNKTRVSMDGLTKSKKEAAEAAKKLQDAQEKLAAFSGKLRDVMEDIPKTFKEFSGIGDKLKDIPKEFHKQAQAVDALREKFKDFTREIAKAPTELQPAMKAMTLEFQLQIQETERWLQALVNSSKVMDQMDRDLQKITASLRDANVEGIKLPQWLDDLSGVDALQNLPAPVITLNEAMKAFKLEAVEGLQAAADKAKAFYDVIEASNVSIVQKKQAFLEWAKLQIEADAQAGKSTEELQRRMQLTTAELERMGIKIKNTAQTTDEATQALTRQISTIWDDFGKGVANAILQGESLGAVFTKVFDQMKQAVMRFVVESIVEGIQKELKKAILETGNLGTALTNLAKKFKEIFTFGGSGTPGVPTPGGGGGGGAPGTGAGGGVTGISGAINVVSGVINAVSGVLSYLQGRRMEQDIGRIEVTTRQIQSQTIAFQETFNTYLPNLLNLQLLIPIKAILWELLTKEPWKGEGGSSEGGSGEGMETLPARPGESASGRGPAPSSTEEIVDKVIPEVSEALEGLGSVANRTGRMMSSSVREPRERIEDWSKEVSSSRRQLYSFRGEVKDTSLDFLGLNIATQGFGETLKNLPDQVEPPLTRAVDYLEENLNDFGTSLWNASKTVASAGFTMSASFDDFAKKMADLPTTVTGGAGVSFGSLANSPAAGTLGQIANQPYGPGYPGYNPPSLMLYPAGERPFNVTINAPSADGMQMANSFVTGLRAHGVEM